jgi:uncharacterized protein (DUF1501 family)
MTARLVRRRELLQWGLGTLAGAGLAGRLYAAPTLSPRFLLVFLRGGYDATNVLIPYSSPFYYEVRPTIAIAPPDPRAAAGALALDRDWALTPALRATIGALYLRSQAAFVPFAGTDDLSRSHFETQDSIELGQPLAGPRDYRSGFMARLVGALRAGGTTPRADAASAIAFTDALPLAFAAEGAAPVANFSLKGGARRMDERDVDLLEQLYAGHHLQGAVASGLSLQQQVAQSIADEMRAASRNAVSTRGFQQQAARMADLMRERYRIGFVDVGGWDTHVNQGAAQGPLANNLADLGLGVQTFAESLADEWRNTVVVVLSEFGRTFRENGNRGTDHGHGSVYWVMGGAVNGGRIAGEQLRIERSTLFQDRDYPVLNDYRAVLGGLFRALWGLSAQQCDAIFPRAQPVDLRLV